MMKKAEFLEVDAGVRYWEGAEINGISDVNGTLTPFKKGDGWCPVIRLADGQVIDWPNGIEADIYFKVCDAGKYWLLDENKNRIGEWGGYYVPNDFLCHGGNGYGDYIILKIDKTGLIQKWAKPYIEWDDLEDGECSWKKINNECE